MTAAAPKRDNVVIDRTRMFLRISVETQRTVARSMSARINNM
jgi:hypothetical protein